MLEPKRGWLRRLSEGLSRTSRQMADQVATAFTARPLDQAQLDDLEEMLIEADLGPRAAQRIAQAFGAARFGRSSTAEEVKEALAGAVAAELIPRQGVFDPLGGPRPYVVLFVGVNGSGKTTTLGKIASDLTGRGARVLIAAGDTFRAAAVEQLQIWGERTGAPVVWGKPETDAAGLAFSALERAKREGIDVLLVDTAGRLHNKTALMDELAKIIRVMRKLDPTAPHSTLLVLDATTGQNALNQVEVFQDLVDVGGLIVTKLDGSARGGVVVALAEEFGLPVHAVGVGEKVGDLRPFVAAEFARGLVGANV
jgi:fused signal recognition particle receptor